MSLVPQAARWDTSLQVTLGSVPVDQAKRTRHSGDWMLESNGEYLGPSGSDGYLTTASPMIGKHNDHGVPARPGR